MMPARDISFDPDFASPADWAAMYRACGLQVLPGRYPMRTAQDKRPGLASWKEFHDELVSDALFGQWFRPGAAPNMGVVTGRASGNLVVIDLDEHTHPSARLWWQGVLVVENHGDEPETCSQITGGGGRQILFRCPAGWHVPTNKTPLGVDIRGQGGWAMLPPSVHLTGRTYEWAPGRAPWECEIADAPPWLLDAIDALVEQHGGDTGGSSGGERTASPPTDFNAFGARIDGREDALSKWVWRTVLELHRATNGDMPEDQGREIFEASLARWCETARTRIPGVDNIEGLERECRGPSAFLAKWKRAIAKWGGRVAAEAAAPRKPERQETVEEVVGAARAGQGRASTGDRETTGQDDEFAPAGAPEPPSGIRATPFNWIDPTSIPPRAWVYGRHYIRKFISTTVAPGGVGKTALGVVEALTIASGRPLLGVAPDESVPVWIWNGEDPLEELQRRIMAAAHHHGMDRNLIVGRLFVDTGRQQPIVIAERTRDGAVINGPVITQVVDTIAANRIGVMIVDPFVACHRVTENDNSEIERVAKAWAYIADVTDCAVELVHHVRKSNGNEVGVEDGRGATALLAAARSARALNRMTDDEAARVAVAEPGLFFRTDNGKANLAPPSSASSWFRLVSVDLDNAVPMSAAGPARPSDRVGVVERWEWPDPTADATAGDMHAVRAKVSSGSWRADPQADGWVGIAIADVMGFQLDAAGIAKAKALQSMWTASGALREVRKPDERRKPKVFVEVGSFND